MGVLALSEYLATSYDPEVEYVDGVLRERHGGEFAHSAAHGNIICGLHRACPDAFVLPSVRIKTAPTRYRVPDVAVVRSVPQTRFIERPPDIAVEVVSETDLMSAFVEKLAEYEAQGVRNIWVADPRLQSMWDYRAGALKRVDAFAAPEGIVLSSDEVFAGC
jgi:Uma2 family endonuclease